MAKNRSKAVFGLLIAMSFILAFALFTPMAKAKDIEGYVKVAESFATFYQKGGDPATSIGAYPIVAETVFDSLVWLDTEQRAKPALAKSWKIADDWKYIDFTLQENVPFHNGARVTAEDVKYSLETAMRKELRFAYGFHFRNKFNRIEAIDPTHVRIYLNVPYPGIFFHLWAMTGIFPKKYREEVGDNGFAEKPVGAGPFKLTGFKQDQYFEMESVENHYRKTPAYKKLRINYVPEDSTRLAMLKAGEADIIRLGSEHIANIKSDPNLRLVLNKHTSGACLVFCDLAFPNDPSPFHDIRVRKAASLAIDRKTICERILFGVAEPIGEAISPITVGYDPSIKSDPYDPETAKALLKQAGYPRGFETVIHGRKTPFLEAIQANLREVGIETKLEAYESGAWSSGFIAKKFRGLTNSFLWYVPERHISQSAEGWFGKGMPWCYSTTDEIDEAIKGSVRAISEKEMADWGRKVSLLIRDSRIRLHLWSVHTPFGVNGRIKYWQPPMGLNFGTHYEYLTLKD